MAIRSGLAAQIGLKAETTFGTAVTPTRFYEFNSESISQTVERIESEGLRTGNRVLRNDRYASGQKKIEGSISLDMTAENTGILLKHALGAVATTNVSAIYTHTATMSDPYGLGLTIEVGRPGNDGTVRAYTYAGCKISSFALSNAVGELCSAEIGIVGSTAESVGSVTSASYAASQELLHFAGAAITFDAVSYPCKEFSVSVDNGLDVDRYSLGSVVNREPVAASMAEVSGSITAEFVDNTAYARVASASHVAIVATWTGSIISGGTYRTLTATIPVARFDGATPNVGGPGIVEQTLDFKGLYDGTNSPLTLAVVNSDTLP